MYSKYVVPNQYKTKLIFIHLYIHIILLTSIFN